MKKILIILTLLFAVFAGKAQDVTGVVSALKSANAEQVSGFFDKILDLKFPDKEEIKGIGKNQAGIALKAFFGNNNIKGFELSSQREMDGTMYIAGKLTNDTDGFKISIMLKLRDKGPQIITVRIS